MARRWHGGEMPKRATLVFNKDSIDALPPGTGGGTWYADHDLPGFYCRVYADGTKTFAVRFSVRGTGVRRTLSLGTYGVVTFASAKARAKELISEAYLRKDPIAEAKEAEKRAITWGDWTKKYFARLDVKRPEFHRYLLGFTSEKHKITGAPTDSTFRDIRSRWMDRAISSITPEDIETERQSIWREGDDPRGNRKITASRWLAVVGACFNAAVRAELLDRNPAAKVRADRENPPRDRVFSDDEMKKLLAALDAEEDIYSRAGVYLAALTGARLSEIRNLEWDRVDLKARCARLPDSKAGKPRFLPLTPRVVKILKDLPQEGRYVIVGTDPDRPRWDLKRPWKRICKRAGLKGVGLHDLRRTLGRDVGRIGGIRVAQETLGHADARTTAKVYTPESMPSLLDAIDKRTKNLPFPKK